MERDITESLCPICLKKIEAKILVKDEVVLVLKVCPEHGKFECPHAWDDPYMFRGIMDISKRWAGSTVKDLIVDVTYRCNMSCPFCFDTVKKEPPVEDIIKKSNSWGLGNIVLYGGEPTMRDNLQDIVKKLKEDRLSVILLSNGLKIDKRKAKELNDAGLDGVVLQFDSLDDQINEKMRGLKTLDKKLHAIDALRHTGIWLSFFVVVVKDMNENQIRGIIEFAGKNSDLIRTVLFAPVSPEGKEGFERKYVKNSDIFNRISELGIMKEDFMSNTEFDLSLTSFLARVGIRRKGVTLCEAICYVHIKNGRYLPLNRLLNLRKVTDALDDSESFFSLGLKLMKKMVGVNPLLLPIMLRVAINLFISKVTRARFKDNIPGMIGIIVNPTQTRYNADYKFINTCNLYADNEGKILCYCENNIFSTGQRRSATLEMSHINSMTR